MIHIGRSATLTTLCGKPVARRWWVEASGIQGGVGPAGLRTWQVVRAEGANCPTCIAKDRDWSTP